MSEEKVVNEVVNEVPNEATGKKKKSKALPIIIILLVLVLLGGGGGAAYMLLLSPAAKSKAQVEVADGFLKDENYKKAITAYKDAISIDPKCVEAYLGLANVYAAQAEDAMDDDEYEDAIDYYDSAIKALKDGIKKIDDEKLTDALDDMESAQKSAEKKAKKYAENNDPVVEVDPVDPVDPVVEVDPVDPVDPVVEVDPVDTDDPYAAETAGFLEAIAEAEVGDIVYFGAYEQDGNTYNGSEYIQWYVVDKKGGKATLLSVYCLEGKAYHEYDEAVTWEDCTLREWLNDDFYNAAFVSSEMDAIASVTLENTGHPLFGGESSNSTTDKVYLLSLEDFETYFGIPMDPDTNPMMTGEYTDWYDYALYCYDKFDGIPAEPTAAAIDNKIWYMTESQAAGYPDYALGKCDWWVRNPGYVDNSYASAIYTSADVGTANYVVTDELVGVRPVITVEYK